MAQVQFTQGLTELQQTLKLLRPPMRIEAFDISNIQGAHPVASMVVFENGEKHREAVPKPSSRKTARAKGEYSRSCRKTV